MNRNRYTLAVYLFLAALAVILGLVALNYYSTGSPLQSLILNLSTELAGAVLVFFIVNQLFFIGRDDDISKEISNLKHQIRDRFSPYSSQEGTDISFMIENINQNNKGIDLLGYNLVGTLRAIREPLAESIKRGANVRILLLDMQGKTGEIMLEHTNKPQMILEDFRNALDFIKDIETIIAEDTKSKGSLQVKLTSWIPSCALFIVHRVNNTGLAQVYIHSPSFRTPIKIRKVLKFAQIDYGDDYNYFAGQFNSLWTEDSHNIH